MRPDLVVLVAILASAILSMPVYAARAAGRPDPLDLAERGSFVLGSFVRSWFYWFVGPIERLALRRIVVPLLLPALVNAWVWVAVHAVRELGISLLLFTRGNGVLSTLIWTSFEQEARIGFAAVLGVLLVLLSLSIALVARSIYAGQHRLSRAAR